MTISGNLEPGGDLERARHLRHPFPEEQAQPVAQAARPDPEIAAPVDRDLGDAFHARAHHRVPVAGQLGLDAKAVLAVDAGGDGRRSEEHTSELQSLMRISYAVFCLKKKRTTKQREN